MSELAVWGAVGMTLIAAAVVIRRSRNDGALRLAALDRGAAPERPAVPTPPVVLGHAALLRWLQRAGYRRRDATSQFVAMMVAAVIAAAVLLFAFREARVLDRTQLWAARAPSVLASLVLPLAAAAPWVVAVALLAAPIVVVRRRRRARVEEIEQDLAAVLELLASMANAGLGFDGALARIIASEPQVRALTQELRMFQRDVLAGATRVNALRQLSERVDIPTINTFCSALIHAEAAGIALTEILRQQADDLRARRRESALLAAQSLPVKLVFPLVLCFLPALFVFTLGPAFASFFRLADQIIGNAH